MKGLLHKCTLTGLAIALSAIIGSGRADARRLSPGEARQRVAAAIQQSPNTRPGGPLKSPGNVAAALTLSYTSAEVSAEKVPAFYVFNVASRSNDAGFVIASGDDRLRPVLAIADQGTFDPANIPANVAWWLGQYEQEIAAYLDSPAAKSADSADKSANSAAQSAEISANSVFDNYAKWSAIQPLLSTTWDQGEPFNNDAPMYGSQRCVTGCVATAMAQIVKYHEPAPSTGNGVKSYTSSAIGQTVSYDFSNPSFDWRNMLDSYASGYTSEQAAAVANLMKACGVAVEMQYTPGESGASSTNVPQALSTYFGFDKRTIMKSRSDYDTPEWETLIYSELSHHRPVYYDGASPYGGHAFVCDGYDQDGLFHINWGWGSYCDGYFALSALNPDGQGIGGYVGGYNIGQGVVLCFPPMAEDIPDIPDYIFDQLSDFSLYGIYSNGDFFNIGVGISRAPQWPVDFYMSVGIEGTDGSLSIARGTDILSLEKGYLYPSLRYNVDVQTLNLPAGKYRIFPMASVKQPDGTYNDYELNSKTYVHEITLTVSESGTRTYEAVAVEVRKPKVEVLEFKALNDFYRESNDNAFSVILTNSGDADYQNTIQFVMGNTIVGQTGLILPPGEVRRFEQTFAIPDNLAGNTELSVEVWETAGNGYKKLFETALTAPIIEGARPSDGQTTSAKVQISVSDPYLKHYNDDVTIKANFKEPLNVSVRLYKQGTDENVGQSGFYWPINWTGGVNLVTNLPCPSTGATGLYDIVLYNFDTNAEVSNRVTLSFGGESDGLVYNPIIGGNGVRITAYNGTASTLILNKELAGMKVTALGSGLFRHNKDIEVLEIPETVTTIGEDALRFMTNLKALFIGNPQALHPDYPQLVMYGTKPGLDIYVPEAAYDGCLGTTLANTYNIYKRITELRPAEDMVTLGVGDVSDVKITTLPATNVNTGLIVAVADTDIATATAKDGIVSIRGIADGETTITVTSAQPNVPAATIKVKVGRGTPVAAVTISGENTVTVGHSIVLSAAVEPANATENTVTWTSSNTDIATVDAKGCVTGVAMGEAVITATAGGVSSEGFKITVNPVPVTEVSIEAYNEPLNIGESIRLKATMNPADAIYESLSWTSEDKNVVTVDNNGNVTGMGPGMATVTLTVTNFGGSTVSTSTTLTVSRPTGMADVSAETGVSVNGRTIIVRTADRNAVVAVYTASGSLVAVRRGSCDIPVAGESLYLVKVGEKNVKVNVN